MAVFRSRFTRLTESRPVAATRGVYDREASALGRQIDRRVGDATRATTAADSTMLTGVVDTKMQTMARSLTAQLIEVQREAHGDVISTLSQFMRKAEGTPSSLENERAAQRLLASREAGLEAQVQQIVAHELGQIRATVTQRIALMVQKGTPVSEASAIIQGAIDAEFWRVERAARTHISHVFNQAMTDAIRLLAATDKNLYMRWTEHIDDASWMPTDNRVANDSKLLHGQVTRPGGNFVMPRDESVPGSMWGKTWTAPPNRPNDRAILLPWKAKYKTPAWIWRGMRKVWLVKRGA